MFVDGQFVRTCFKGECKMMTVGTAKGLDYEAIQSVSSVKSDEQMTKALAPSLETMSASLKGLDAQKAVSIRAHTYQFKYIYTIGCILWL